MQRTRWSLDSNARCGYAESYRRSSLCQFRTGQVPYDALFVHNPISGSTASPRNWSSLALRSVVANVEGLDSGLPLRTKRRRIAQLTLPLVAATASPASKLWHPRRLTCVAVHRISNNLPARINHLRRSRPAAPFPLATFLPGDRNTRRAPTHRQPAPKPCRTRTSVENGFVFSNRRRSNNWLRTCKTPIRPDPAALARVGLERAIPARSIT